MLQVTSKRRLVTIGTVWMATLLVFAVAAPLTIAEDEAADPDGPDVAALVERLPHWRHGDDELRSLALSTMRTIGQFERLRVRVRYWYAAPDRALTVIRDAHDNDRLAFYDAAQGRVWVVPVSVPPVAVARVRGTEARLDIGQSGHMARELEPGEILLDVDVASFFSGDDLGEITGERLRDGTVRLQRGTAISARIDAAREGRLRDLRLEPPGDAPKSQLRWVEVNEPTELPRLVELDQANRPQGLELTEVEAGPVPAATVVDLYQRLGVNFIVRRAAVDEDAEHLRAHLTSDEIDWDGIAARDAEIAPLWHEWIDDWLGDDLPLRRRTPLEAFDERIRTKIETLPIWHNDHGALESLHLSGEIAMESLANLSFDYFYRAPNDALLVIRDGTDGTPLWISGSRASAWYDPLRGKLLEFNPENQSMPRAYLWAREDGLQFGIGNWRSEADTEDQAEGAESKPTLDVDLPSLFARADHPRAVRSIKDSDGRTGVELISYRANMTVTGWFDLDEAGDPGTFHRLELVTAAGPSITLEQVSHNAPLPREAFTLPHDVLAEHGVEVARRGGSDDDVIRQLTASFGDMRAWGLGLFREAIYDDGHWLRRHQVGQTIEWPEARQHDREAAPILREAIDQWLSELTVVEH